MVGRSMDFKSLLKKVFGRNKEDAKALQLQQNYEALQTKLEEVRAQYAQAQEKERQLERQQSSSEEARVLLDLANQMRSQQELTKALRNRVSDLEAQVQEAHATLEARKAEISK